MASKSGNNKIVLKGDWGHWEEGPCAVAVSPGMNVARTPAARSWERDTWGPAATDFVGTGTTAGGTSVANPIAVVIEDALQGKTVNEAYTAGENIRVFQPRKGDVIQVLVAAGQTVLKGRGLSAVAGGKWNADLTNAPVQALESSGGALAADTLIRVVVL